MPLPAPGGRVGGVRARPFARRGEWRRTCAGPEKLRTRPRRRSLGRRGAIARFAASALRGAAQRAIGRERAECGHGPPRNDAIRRICRADEQRHSGYEAQNSAEPQLGPNLRSVL